MKPLLYLICIASLMTAYDAGATEPAAPASSTRTGKASATTGTGTRAGTDAGRGPAAQRPGATKKRSGETGAPARRHRAQAAPARTGIATISASAGAAGLAAATDEGRNWVARADVRAFIQRMVEQHGFESDRLTDTLARARRLPDVLRLIAPPPSGYPRSWETYRSRFLDPTRVSEGLRFWEAHAAALSRAQTDWRVPPEIIVSIIGIESLYGRVTGSFRVIDALTTLAFDHPPRAAFFSEELEQFLILSRDSDTDPFSVRGSYAGAIGLPQFMPGSIRRHAIDFDGDGRIDLRGSPVDAIGSVARFLAEHGWVGGEATHFSARVADESRLGPLLAAGIEPKFTLAELSAGGVSSQETIADDTLLSLIELPSAGGVTNWRLGARNFYVISRYNRSSFYAMAVIDLAQALAAGRGR